MEGGVCIVKEKAACGVVAGWMGSVRCIGGMCSVCGVCGLCVWCVWYV